MAGDWKPQRTSRIFEERKWELKIPTLSKAFLQKKKKSFHFFQKKRSTYFRVRQQTLIMEQTDDIDLILTLNPHGWSTFFLFVKDKKIEFTITHVFGDPYSDLILALSNLINGQDSSTFFWYGEPGGHKLVIMRSMTQQHKVTVSIYEFEESFHEEPKSYDLRLDFQVKLKQLITIFYFQLKKTHLLLLDKQYAQSRAQDFSFQEFHQFDRLVKPYINI